jgi:hypothetical protein
MDAPHNLAHMARAAANEKMALSIETECPREEKKDAMQQVTERTYTGKVVLHLH